MRSAYVSLAKAQAEKCVNLAVSDRWALADSWLGVYASLDEAGVAGHVMDQSCRSFRLAEAREGLAISWLELSLVQPRLAHTPMFRQATEVLDNSAQALSARLPPLHANASATSSYIRSSVEATAHSRKAGCDTAFIVSQ